MNIGLLGFGVVGRGVYEITSARDDMSVKKVICLEDITLPDAEVTRALLEVMMFLPASMAARTNS